MTLQKYPSINGLRAVSILLVIFSHLNLHNAAFDSWKETFWALNLLKYFLVDGQLGVTIFFVISGFLITTLLEVEEKQTANVSLKKFYIRRTLRIFPAYYFLLFVYFLLQLAGYLHFSGLSWLTSLTYTKQFNRTDDWYSAHFWSLSVEESFYIFWPLIFKLGNVARKGAALLIVLLVAGIRTVVHYHPIDWINELTMFLRMDAIAVGCLFALYQTEIRARIERYWSVVFFFSVFLLFVLRDLPYTFRKFHLEFVFVPLGLTHGVIADILIGFILLYSVFGPQGLWFKMLNSRVMSYIGLLSYSIYLWQQLFIAREHQGWINQFPQNVLLAFAAALGSYYLIEKPFLKLKDRFSF